MELFSNTLQFPRWNQNDQCCALCRASAIGELSYRDFTNNAAWIPTLWKHFEWKTWSGRSKCRLFDIPRSTFAVLWAKMKKWYKNNLSPHRYAYFKRLSMYVRKSGPPKLRGKEAEVKGLGLLILHLWQQYCNETWSYIDSYWPC